MTEQAWTPEPWTSDHGVLISRGVRFSSFYGYSTPGSKNAWANADRTAACVNPMAGIEDPVAFVERAKALMAEVDRQAEIADRVQARLPEILGIQPMEPNDEQE